MYCFQTISWTEILQSPLVQLCAAQAPGIVEVDLARDLRTPFGDAFACVQVNVLVLDRLPQPLEESERGALRKSAATGSTPTSATRLAIATTTTAGGEREEACPAGRDGVRVATRQALPK